MQTVRDTPLRFYSRTEDGDGAHVNAADVGGHLGGHADVDRVGDRDIADRDVDLAGAAAPAMTTAPANSATAVLVVRQVVMRMLAPAGVVLVL